MKLCILGNWHAGALRQAWTRMAHRNAGTSITFAAARNSALVHLHTTGSVLATEDADLKAQLRLSSGSDRLDPAAYDRICVVACGSFAGPILGLYGEWRADEHKARIGEFTMMSDACFDACVTGLLSKTLAVRLCRELAALTAIPISLIPQPMPSDRILHDGDVRFAPWRLARDAADDQAIANTFRRVTIGLARACHDP